MVSSSATRFSQFLFLLLTTYCLLLTTGCIRRQLTIRSEPSGAELWLNDKRLGTTPFEYDLTWYGWYRLSLKKEGYEQLDDHVLIKSPWYFWIPLDLAMELLPVPVRDERELAYQLVPRTPLPEPVPPSVDGPPSSEPTAVTPEPQAAATSATTASDGESTR